MADEMVSVPVALLRRVLEQAEEDSVKIEGEFAVGDKERELCQWQQSYIRVLLSRIKLSS